MAARLVWGMAAALLIVLGGSVGYWAFGKVLIHLEIREQPLIVRLPPRLEGIDTATEGDLAVRMLGNITAAVPLDQTLKIPVKDTLTAKVRIDAPVHLQTVIPYEGVVPVDTFADIVANVTVNFQNVKQYRNLRLKARLPLKLDIPLKLSVPVDQVVQVAYEGPLTFDIDHVVTAPVTVELNTRLAVDQDFSLPVRSSFRLDADVGQEPLNATIRYADLKLDPETLRLQVDADEEPARK